MKAENFRTVWIALFYLPSLTFSYGQIFDINGDYKISGNVGIGTNLPLSKLHVSASGAESAIRINADLNQQSALYFYSTNSPSTTTTLYRPSNTNDLRIWGAIAGDIISFKNDYTGNIGIGTNSPLSKLHVSASGAESAIRINADLNQQSALYFYSTNSPSTATTLYRPSGTNDLRIWGAIAGDIISFKNDYTGNIGIGTNSPLSKLHVSASGAESAIRINADLNQQSALYFYSTNSPSTATTLYRPSGTNDLRIWGAIAGDIISYKNDNTGNVGIGTNSPDSKLTVAGNIHSREVKVTINAGSDFVFHDDYDLRTLNEVEKFITENKHLPDIESAKEMKENGLELGKMDMKLLQKIEELTLYLIDFKKEIDKMKEENLKLKNRIVELEKD